MRTDNEKLSRHSSADFSAAHYAAESSPTVQLLFDATLVAELKKLQGKYVFRYLEAFKTKGLAPLPGLPDLDKLYESPDLFQFFEERIPDTRRPEIREWITQHKLDEHDKLSLLAALSRAVTDSFELRYEVSV